MAFKFFRLRFSSVILSLFLLGTRVLHAQVINDSSTIRIIKGTSFVSLGNLTNASGTIINDGTMQVQGNFNNNNKYNSTGKEDSILLTGDGIVTLASGSATFNSLKVDKKNGGGVNLSGNVSVGSHFDLQSGFLSTDPNKSYELIAPVAATFTFAEGTQVTGKVRRTNWVNDTAVTFHQPGMMLKTSGGTAPTSILVKMVPGKDPTASLTDVKRYFYFSTTGGNNYTTDVTFPYSLSELNANIEGNLVAWHYDAIEKWNQKIIGNTNNPAAHYVASAGIKAAIFANTEWKLAAIDDSNINANFFVYPIPATTYLNIYVGAETDKKVVIQLFDASGKECKLVYENLQKGLNRLNLNITGLASGQYILKVAEGKALHTKVILINK